MKLSNLVDKMKPSPTLALTAKAKELKAQGKDVVALSVGEPDWDTLEDIKKAGIQAIKEGHTKYSPASGIPELKKVIAEDMNQFLAQDYSPANVSVTSGGKFAIFAAFQCILDPGDKVGFAAPYWVSYPTMVDLCGAQAEIIETKEENNFKLTPEELDQALKLGLKLIVLNSPSNPTGMMYTKKELAALAKVLEDFPDTWILTDDIYARLTFSEKRAPHLLQESASLADRTVMIDGASKSYSMTGWRVGWAVGPSNLIKAMGNYQSQTVSCAATFNQMASVVAVRDCQEEVRKKMEDLAERKDYFKKSLEKLSGIKIFEPDGAFYFWIGIKDLLGKRLTTTGKMIDNSGDFANHLLEEENLVVVPGKEFGLDGYLRLSFAVEKATLDKATEKLGNFLSKLD